MINTNSIEKLFDATVVGPDNDKIGTVGQIFVDEQDGHPTWATVKTGLFGTKETFVPLDSASYTDDVLHVAFGKDRVKDAPRIDTDSALTPQEEDELYSYYGVGGTDSGVNRTESTYADSASTGTTTMDATAAGFGATTGAAGADADRDLDLDRDRDRDTVGTAGVVGHDTSGPTTDDAMTRSEEQLHVGTEQVQTGRARLRKYVVTEHENVTVPVSHEEVRLEREPITGGNVDDALDGPAISEEEHEVILSEERPVVAKETVPVERVRLDKETVTEQAQVSEDVRREEIELEGDADDTNRRL